MKKILLYFILLTFGICQSQNIFQDNFSNYTTDIQLSGQGTWTNDSSLPGGLGTAGVGGFNSNVITNTVSYLNYGTSANSIEIKPNSDACGISFPTVTSGDIYISMILNLSAAQTSTNSSDFFRVMSGDNYNTTFRLYATKEGNQIIFGVSKGADGNLIKITPTSYSANTDHLLVFKYTQGTGANDDIIKLFIDPIFLNGEPANPKISSSSGTDQAGNIDRLCFRQNWTSGMPTGKAGLISVARTWADLAFNLSLQQFDKDTFSVSTNQANIGILSIKSNIFIDDVRLTIYGIEGKVLETKTINLKETTNYVNINPLSNSGIYIAKIVSQDNQKFFQKIIIK